MDNNNFLLFLKCVKMPRFWAVAFKVSKKKQLYVDFKFVDLVLKESLEKK